MSIKPDTICDIIVERPDLYSEADLRMDNQEFDKALILFEKSLVQVPDGWMKHEILSRQIECLINLNRFDEAALRYVQLVQLEPKSPFYDRIPLSWTSVELSPRTKLLAQNWIRQQKYPYVALLGASLLLNSDKKNEVQSALNALAKSEDADVATLAQMQLNRLSLTPLPETTLDNLEKKVDVLPKSLQYGPRFVLAQLWSRCSAAERKADKAALSYLHCAVNNRTPVDLQARSLYSAGAILLDAERRDEAFRIFNLLLEKYPDSQWSQQAKRTAGGNL